MQPDESDLTLLLDMFKASREIVQFTKGFSLNRFARNKVVRYAVERQITVIGEAAKKISIKFKDAHPEFPWRSIIAQRNIIAHEYGEIIIERVWLTASVHIPDLLAMLEPLIPDDLKRDL
ncbi:MAG: HepT-like ribonuclease domain-containing protein [Calditrichota bacterium]